MPLSEDEQRILHQIEEQFYESDPAFAREVASTTVYTHALRSLRWSIVGFVAGVAVLLLTLSTSVVFAFGGFLICFASLVLMVSSFQRLGRAGMQQVTGTMKASGVRDYFGGAGKRVRERFNREEEEQ